MRRAKKTLLLTLSLILVSTLGIMTNHLLLPSITSVNAVLTCPTGGPANACLTVSLDVNSRPTTTASTTCAVPSGQKGVCDTTVTTTALNATTFRVGAILNASAAARTLTTSSCVGPPASATLVGCGVFSWQFGIIYDPNLVTPQGDPTSYCAGLPAHPDCGEDTVWYGSNISPVGNPNTPAGGQVNWASYPTATHPISITEDPTHHTAEILIGFAFLAPSGSLPSGVVINSRNSLASVAFGLVGKGSPTFSIADVIFADANAAQIPGIIGAPDLQNDRTLIGNNNYQNRLEFSDTNANGVWDSGEPVIYDSNGDGKYEAGTLYSDTLLAGSAPGNNTLLSTDPLIRFQDLNANDIWDSGEPVSYDSNNNNLYDTGEPVISSPTPSTPCTGGLLPNNTCGAVSDTITNDPPHAIFAAIQTPGQPYVYTFTSSSTDSDGTITGYYWDFGDGTQDLNVSGSTVFLHNYGSLCLPTCPNGLTFPGAFTVTLRVIDNLNATGAARDSSDAPISNGQPSHKTQLVFVDALPIPSFTFTPSHPVLGRTVSFDASASSDSDGSITSYRWNFNDTQTGTGVKITHTFSAAGLFNVTLTVQDNVGATSTKLLGVPVRASDQAPTVGFTSDKVSPVTSDTITLTITSSDIDGTVTSLAVDWGDGTTHTLPGTATTDTHAYNTFGTFTIKITATDDSDSTTIAQANQVVLPRHPVVTISGPSSANTGATVTITLTSSAPDGTISSIKVDWGDGTTDSLTVTATTATHTYATVGNYNVTITATDSNGQTSTKSQTIAVTTPPGLSTSTLIALIAVPIVAIVTVGLLLLRRRKPAAKPDTPRSSPANR